jgi:hypothetical protein
MGQNEKTPPHLEETEEPATRPQARSGAWHDDSATLPINVDIPFGKALPFVATSPPTQDPPHRPSSIPPDGTLPFVVPNEPPSPPLPAARDNENIGPSTPPAMESRASKIGAWRPPGSSAAAAPTLAEPSAAAGSALAFSNAAADAGIHVEAKRSIPAREEPAPRGGKGDAIELVGFDAETLPRLRKHPAWKKILAEMNPKPKGRADDNEGDTRDNQKEAKDRRDVLAILKRGESSGRSDIDDAINEAIDGGMPLPPLVLVMGELDFAFDEMEALKATLAIVSPFVPADKKLKETVDVVREVMGTPGIERARAVVEKLSARIRAAFGQTDRGAPATYLDAQTEPILLEGRCYQKRTVMGKPWIRASLYLEGDDRRAPIPAYLAAELSSELPMFRRFPARLVAEARPRVDQGEAAEVALKVVVVGRRIPRL